MSSDLVRSSMPFFIRHEFLIRRLHSLSGLVPVGAYMVVHLLTNASIISGPGRFQSNVSMIHNLEPALPLIEWLFIFGPILFHGLFGVWIIQTGKTNVSQYKYTNNRRYTWQRWTGVMALVFIFVHVFHLHGWFHFDWWLDNVANPLGMARFRAYNAASSLALAMSGLWSVFYAAGLLACVYHLANGIWTAGITWGVWISPSAQRRATIICSLFGFGLAFIGLSTLWTIRKLDVNESKAVEDAQYEVGVETGEIRSNPHKRSENSSSRNNQMQPITVE